MVWPDRAEQLAAALLLLGRRFAALVRGSAAPVRVHVHTVRPHQQAGAEAVDQFPGRVEM